MNTSDNSTQDTTDRPLGYWLKATDRLMAAEFAAAFQHEGITRRDWRLLNLVEGTADRRLPAHKLAGLIERGWIAAAADGWTLTDEGRAAKERLGVIVDGIRLKVTDAVPPEAYATTIATLEQIARAYGWEDGIDLPRGARHGRHGFGEHGFGHERGKHGRGFGRARGHGFGREHGFGHDHGFGRGHHPGFTPADGPHHPGSIHPARAAQHAYERGFEAGFDRGSHAR